jgi:prepilin-type N-terminal cleavage/methylation domain-containing protein
MMRGRVRLTEEGGLTLVELLVVVLVGGIVTTIAASSIVQSLGFHREHSAQLAALSDVKIAFERVARDIRGADPLLSATPEEVRFRLYPDEEAVTVSYLVVDGNLVRREDGVDRLALRGVTLPDETSLLTYFDIDGVELTPLDEFGEPQDIPNVEARSIRIRLRVPYGHRGESVDLETNAMLRNSEA